MSTGVLSKTLIRNCPQSPDCCPQCAGMTVRDGPESAESSGRPAQSRRAAENSDHRQRWLLRLRHWQSSSRWPPGTSLHAMLPSVRASISADVTPLGLLPGALQTFPTSLAGHS
jgi:hypothetical protein